MKIKYRIVLLFTAIVTVILLLLCVSIYFLSDFNRQADFRKRLKNRAYTTLSLLNEVKGIDTTLLKRIDESTLIALQERSVVVYDQNGKITYAYSDENTRPVYITDTIRKNLAVHSEYYFSDGHKDAVALSYRSNNNAYIIINAAYDRDGFEKHYYLGSILIFSFLSGIFVTFILGGIFSDRLVRPIKNITNDVKEISSQNLSRRIKTNQTKDELNELSTTLNELMDRLQNSFEIQRRFIANASHELSTPLTAILSQLEITLQKERNITEYKEVLLSVYDDVINLTQLTKNLLEMAKAGDSSAGIELSLFRIDELFLKLPYSINKADPSYTVKLYFDVFPEEEDRLLVFGNPDLLFSAIKNMVINACKYSKDHEADVALHFIQNIIEIRIADNGPGIKEEDIPYIFQPFYRGKNDTPSHQGFGLGLSLAHKIINIHKGSVTYAQKPGGGSIFITRLPIASFFHGI